MADTARLSAELRARCGFAARPGWLTACAAHLAAQVPGFASMPPAQQVPLVLDQLLDADFHDVGAGGCLPDVQVCVQCCARASACVRRRRGSSTTARAHLRSARHDRQF